MCARALSLTQASVKALNPEIVKTDPCLLRFFICGRRVLIDPNVAPDVIAFVFERE